MSGCDVCIGGDIGDMIQDYDLSEKIAEVVLACYECRGPIGIGEEYELCTGEFYDEEINYATCLLCAEIAEVFSCGKGRTHGDLWERMQDHAFDDLTTATECFRELSAAAKQAVLDRWNKWKFGKAS